MDAIHTYTYELICVQAANKYEIGGSIYMSETVLVQLLINNKLVLIEHTAGSGMLETRCYQDFKF